MSYSIASRYSQFFKLMGNPYTLVILDHLFENKTKVDVETLVSISKANKGVVISICDELHSLGIVSRDYEGDVPTYEATNSKYANFVEKIIEYID